MKKFILASIACVTILTINGTAQAGYVYVGSWAVDNGPVWYQNVEPVYSGQSAAALLFGGSATDYVISTVDSKVADINFETWTDGYSIGAAIHPQNYSVACGGGYGCYGATSAYIQDHSVGNINYAFRVVADPANVPEPATLALLSAGVVGLGMIRRRNPT